uniref:N-acetyltransferase domain-containing protein n=2 Tax=Kalmanozyma brasiliensis (strain GHG001) TaxID=1365824 RepID=V5GUJ8_KALBG
MARMQHDAFNDPTNSTHDEVSTLLSAEVDPETGRMPTRDEMEDKMTASHAALFDKEGYCIVGAYSEAGVMAGFAIWRAISPITPPESVETNKTEKEQPSLFNRFFAQMNRTRDATMEGKRYWFLKLLIIDPSFQRKGLGSKLVNWGTSRADEEGVCAWLESSPMGKGAYLKAGFRVLGMDRVDEPKAQKGYVEWPYMIHEPKGKEA